jgi:Ser/Thr protein kinase RdoA (MazF antagonist)
MDGRSEKIFEAHGEAILSQAAERYGFDKETLNRLGSFESLVYEFRRAGRDYILKITHSLHRKPDLVRGELDWTDYLINHGIDICRTVPSDKGGNLEIIDGHSIRALGDDYFIVYVLEKVSGKRTERSDWDEELVREWGRAVGRMNALAKAYLPAKNVWRRFEWHQDDSLKFERHIPETQPLVLQRGREIIKRMLSWPTDRDSYGLIHSDMHHGNFVVEDGRLIAFDFDDCHYGWFGFDISIPLFYVLRDHQVDPDDVVFARWFFGNFLDGYRRENNIAPVWIERLPEFMKLREMDLYSVIYAENAAEANAWCRRFMIDRQYRIENAVPVIDLDFSEFE